MRRSSSSGQFTVLISPSTSLQERSQSRGGNANFAKDWRLYALIDCLFCPAWPSSALFHFRNVLETIRATARVDLPALPPLLYTSPAQLKFERDSEGCTFLDAQPLVPAVVKTELCQTNTTSW